MLLTPVVLATVRWLRAPVRPAAYASAHLANVASLLLPLSNLTNLLAFHVADLPTYLISSSVKVFIGASIPASPAVHRAQ